MDTRRMCPQCRAFITTKDRVCPYCNEPVGPRAIDVREPGALLGGLIPAASFTTSLILFINLALYGAVMLYSSSSESPYAFSQALGLFGSKMGRSAFEGDWWRLVTAGFLHGGIAHILMNSFALYDLGAQVEDHFKWRRFVVIYFVSTVGGFAASSWWSPHSQSVGASAGIFGLIGAMIALGARSSTTMGSEIKAMYIRYAIYGLLFGLLPYFAIDNAAHLGGLAAGFVCAYIADTPKLVRGPREVFWDIAAWTCIAVTAYSFFQVYRLLTSPYARLIVR